MIDGDVDSAQAVTHTKIAVTQNDGTVVIKQVLESLDTAPQRSTGEPSELELPPVIDDPFLNHMNNMSPPPTGPPKTYRVNLIIIATRVTD